MGLIRTGAPMSASRLSSPKDLRARLYETVAGSREFRPRTEGKQVRISPGLRLSPDRRGPMPPAKGIERKADFEAAANPGLTWHAGRRGHRTHPLDCNGCTDSEARRIGAAF